MVNKAYFRRFGGKQMRIRDLSLLVAGLLAVQMDGGAIMAQAIHPQVHLRSIVPDNVAQAAQHAADSNRSTLPSLSFATQDGLFSILPDGDSRQELMGGTTAPFFNIDWTADGNRVAVVRNFGEVYVMGTGQTTPTALFDSDCFRPPTLDLAWQTSGETLVIQQSCNASVSGESGSLDIFLTQPTGQLQSLNNLPDKLQSDLYISPGGTEVAYVYEQHIYVLSTDGSTPRQVTQTPGIYGAAGSPLAWSPDGERIAFFEGNYPFQRINVIHTDGTNRQVLTPAPNFQIYRSQLAWSPDGSKLAFYQPSNPPGSNQEIIKLIDLASGDIETLTRPGFYNALSWSPDSQRLAFASGSQFERQAMFVYDLASSNFTVLTPEPFQNVLASAWSPHGDWIAFTATPIGDELGTQILYTVRPDASGFTALTSSNEYVYPFAWIPQP
jgi:WD40 repeat protein